MLKEENKEKTQKQKHTMKRVLQDIGHYRWMVLLSLLLAGITVALTLYIPILIGKAVKCPIPAAVSLILTWTGPTSN